MGNRTKPVPVSWRWMWWSYNNNVTTCMTLHHDSQPSLCHDITDKIENLQCLRGSLESQRWRLPESNCVLSIYGLHNSLGSLSLSLLGLIADTFVCTEVQELHIAIMWKSHSWQTALFIFLFPSVSQLAQPLLWLWGEHLWIVFLDIKQEILKHSLQNNTIIYHLQIEMP